MKRISGTARPSRRVPGAARAAVVQQAGVGLISALLVLLSFPVFPHHAIWPLAWVGLVPLLVSLSRGGWKVGLLQAFAFGYPFMIGVLAWVYWMGVAPWLLLSLTQVAYIAVFTLGGALLAPLWKREAASPGAVRPWRFHLAAVLFFPCAWIFMEWLRSLGRLSIPWGFLSSTQVHIPALVTTAKWWGAYGVSFLIVMVNSALANWYLSRGRDRSRAGQLCGGVIILGAAAAIVGARTTTAQTGQPLKIGLIQGNIFKDDPRSPLYRGHVIDTYTRMSREAVGRGAGIIVWPETVVPGPLMHDAYLHTSVTSLVRSTHDYYLVGSPDYIPDIDGAASGDIYNSSFVLSPGGDVLGRYDKQHLVPFGEYVPGRSWLPFLNAYGVPAHDLAPGRGHRPIRTPEGDWGVMICYESMYPEIARQTVQAGAGILFVITNDQWFGDSSAPFDHAADGAFRAAETGRWLIQAASTGVSFFASPDGAIHDRTEMFVPAIDVGSAYLAHGETLYTRLGDWPPLLSIPVLLAGFALIVRRRSAW